MPQPSMCSTFLQPISLLLLFCLSAQVYAASAVLGLDIGTEYIKAALVKPGIPLEIVLTKDSRRKESAALAFKPGTQDSHGESKYPERLYGADALALAPRFPADVFPNIKQLLGSLEDSSAAAESYSQRYPSLQITSQTQGLALKSNGLSEEKDPFTIEELLSMQIQSMKANAESMAGKGHLIQDAVVTIPAFYTVDERRAVQTAVELAGLRVMALVTDGLAVGLNYATSRTFPNVDKDEKPEYHLIYDMGAGSTTATILRFQAKSVKSFSKTNKTSQEVSVLGAGWDKSLGGDVMNHLIMDDMIEKFVSSSAAKAANVQLDAVRKHGRTMAKTWKEAERIRMVLSANQQTSASFEGFYDDVDFKYKITRTEFEEMTAALGSRLDVPISTALAGARLSMADINSVVLHGGTVRTPFVQKSLEKVVGDAAKLRSNVNADEAAVFGAAFRAAGLSPSFRVKDIKTDDIANYGATLQWTADGKARKQNIFLPTSSVGTVKQMPFNIQTDFDLSIVQYVEEQERPVYDIKVSNLTASVTELTKTYNCARDQIKTQLTVRLDPVLGIPEIAAGSVSCEYDPSEKKDSVVDGVKNLFGWGSKSEEEEADEANTEAADSSSASSKTSSSTASSAKGKASDKPKVQKKKTAIINLKLDIKRTDGKVLSNADLTRVAGRLLSFDSSDEARKRREESFNILEALTYRVRDLITDESIVAVSSKKQRDAIETMLSTTSDWLYGEGAKASLKSVKEKLEGLKDLVDPVMLRRDEVTKRPAAVEAYQKAIDTSSSVLELVRGSISKAAEASASAISAAEAAASSASSMVVGEPSSETASATDDLDDEEATSTSSSTLPTPTWDASPFTDYDLTDITSAFESAKEWLEDKLKAQNDLTASDVPAILSSELEKRTERLNDVVTRLLLKQSRGPPKPRVFKNTKSKSKSTKTKTAKSSATDAAESPTSPVEEQATQTPVGEGEGHDEL